MICCALWGSAFPGVKAGMQMGICIKADRTVTFTCGKEGLFTGEGPEYAGVVDIVDIGIPEDIWK